MLMKPLRFLVHTSVDAMQSLRSNRGDNVVKNEEKCGKAVGVTLLEGSLKILEVDGCAKWMRKEWRIKMEMGKARA